jgi:hypothetical protein
VPDEGSGPPEFESPLDDLFVEGARYREPSAAERARQAREFERRGKEAARENRRRRKRETVRSGTRKWLPWAGLAAVVLAVWGLTSLASGGDDDREPATTSSTTTAVDSTTTSPPVVTPNP